MTRMIFHGLPLSPLSRVAGSIGLVALTATAIGGWFAPDAFFQGWLVGWLFVLGIALAAMLNVMIHELTGGEWGIVLRPPLEAAMLTLPACAVLALPLAFGLPHLFAWARPDAVAVSELLQAKAWFLNVPSFLIRNAAWLIAWSVLALAFARRLGSARPDDVRARRRIAVAGLLIYLATITVFAYDWIVSLVPEWSSTAAGVRLGAAQFLAAFAFAVAFAVFAPDRRGTGEPPTARDFQDFGNLLLTFAMFWAYIAYMEFFIVWGEDLPRETSWYLPRMKTSWQGLALAVIALDFVLPFGAMLFREVKRNPYALSAVCALVLVGQWLDTVWLALPSLRPGGFTLHWLDIAASVAEIALWLAVVASIVDRLPMRRRTRRAERASAHG
jgi:hypothetical protein